MNSKLDRLFWIPILICVLAAISDIIGCAAFNIKGWDPVYWESYANAVYVLWYSFPIIIGIVYYILVRDLSESLALAIGTLILYAFGWEDLFFYLLSPVMSYLFDLPNYIILHDPFKSIPWLDYPHPAGIIQHILGYEHNNLYLLFLNCILGFIVYLVFFELMKKLEYKLVVNHTKIEI